MKHKYMIVALVVALSTFAFADSWSVGPHYLRLNQAVPGGHSDNYGLNISYDWNLSDMATFGVEGLGSWANDAEIYGLGINLKYNLYRSGSFAMYGGGYIDYLYATELQKELPGIGQNEDGFMYGPLFGMKWDISETTSLFAQYRYGWFDGGTIRRAFDESNMIVCGLKVKF